MTTETEEESPHQPFRQSWPKLFTQRRQFDRGCENQPYIEFLQTQRFEDEDEEYSSIGDDDDDISLIASDSDTEGNEIPNCNSNVRLFMTGTTGDEELEYLDQVEQVASFCEQASVKRGQYGTNCGQDMKSMALLDDRITGGTSSSDEKRPSRASKGPLTAQQLRDELSRKVRLVHMFSVRVPHKLTHIVQRFRVESENNTPFRAFEDNKSDVERRKM
jgi:hypothetical protein